MAPSIHQATIFDWDRLVALFDGYRQFYGTSSDLVLSRQFLADRMTRKESVALLARGDDGAPLGFALLFPSVSSVRAAPIYVLNDLFLVPAARRQGMGALLLQSAADMARASGAIQLKLSTAITNTNMVAQRLYEIMKWTGEEEFQVCNLSW